jgi:hypothetical protein
MLQIKFYPLKEDDMKKIQLRYVAFLLISLALFLPTCGGGGGGGRDAGEIGDDSPTPPSPYGPVTIGAAGGEVTEMQETFPTYGVKYVIPAGALTEDRVFSTWYKFSWERAKLPDGFIPYPDQQSCPELVVSGNKPYGLNLTISFPVKGMTVAANEKACAIAYDSRLSKWIIIVPNSVDANTMTVTTTYRDYWMWGKMNLDVIATEHLVGAVKERYGEEVWNNAISAIATAINTLNTLKVDRTCQSWTNVRGDLQNLINGEKQMLLNYQSQLGSCGTCDLLSEQFGLDLTKYVTAKIAIFVSERWDEIMGGTWLVGLPFVGQVDFMFQLERFVAYAFLESMQCNYTCVTQKLGLPVYAHYAIHNVYLVTQLVVVLAIEDGWVCP